MQLSENLSKVLTGIIEPLAEIVGLELVDINLRKESGQTVLDVVIDKDSGVSVDDCARLSRKISLALDVEDPIPFKYYLEVGSPGIFRKLKSKREFEKNLGARVKAVFQEPVSGLTTIVGVLSGFADGQVTISGEGKELKADLQQIKNIQLFPDI